MSIKIVHISDWHGQHMDAPWLKCYLPWADLYLVTGDMQRNYMKYDSLYCDLHNIPWVDPIRETHYQAKDVRNTKFRKFLGNPNADVVIIGGNHDYVHMVNSFAGGPVTEIQSPSQIVDACGLRIGGFRGVSRIAGDWIDEMTDDELEEQVSKLSSEIDILITHAPPHGIMDKIGDFGKGPSVGIKALGSYLQKQSYNDGPLRLHCFGHIHQQFGCLRTGTPDKPLMFSNAATGYHEYLWDGGDVKHVRSEKNLFRKNRNDGYGER
jgi:Icc-related predicted phosphoesterase